MKVIQYIMTKPQWRQKLNKPEIIAKWKAEAADWDVRSEVFEYSLKELSWLAAAGDPISGIEPSGVDFVWVGLQASNNADPARTTDETGFTSSDPTKSFPRTYIRGSAKLPKTMHSRSQTRTIIPAQMTKLSI
jgi:hypothetical protein